MTVRLGKELVTPLSPGYFQRMSRPVRIHIPRATYLIQMRAREGVAFFTGEEDRRIFLQSLEDSAGPAGVTVYAYALLERNALLFVRAGQVPLSRFVHRTQAGFFNRLRAQNGSSHPRIRDRHRAILVEEGELFLPVIRRVHLAPIKGSHWSNESEARRWGEVSSNRWTSFPMFTSGESAPNWFGGEEVLERFGEQERPEDGFYRYIIDGVKNESTEDLLDDVVAMSLLGSIEFVERYYELAKGRRRHLSSGPQEETPRDVARRSFQRILTVVGDAFSVSPSELQRPRSRHPGRKYVVELALRHALDEGGVKALGERLGVSGSALAHLRRAFRDELSSNTEARSRFDSLEGKLLAK